MNKLKNIIIIVSVLCYVFMGIHIISVTEENTENFYNEFSGRKATDMIYLIANGFYITDKEVAELKELKFKNTLYHPAYKRLYNYFKNRNFSAEINSAHLIIPLDEIAQTEVNLTKDTNFYNLPVDISLNAYDLLSVRTDVNKSSQARYYSENNRYMHVDLKGGGTSYGVSYTSMGKSVVGYVPFYSTSNKFVGYLALIINADKTQDFFINSNNTILFMFLIPTIALTLIYLIIFIINYIQTKRTVHTDAMTTLYNRRFLDICLPRLTKECMQTNSYLTSMMIDIDFFKNYNDNYGHQKGDEAITGISLAIVSVLRKNSDFVFRYGGEEIFVLLPHTSFAQARIVAKKIIYAISDLKIKHSFSTASDYVSVSLGVYYAIPKSSSKEANALFVLNADKALYLAKSKGRNTYVIWNDDKPEK